MYKIRTRKAGIIGFFSVAAALIIIGAFANFARADISNPHPTPPANSVTNTMIQTNTILDSNVSSSSQIQLSKIKYVGTQGDFIVGSSSEATSTAAAFIDTNSGSVFIGSTTPSQSATSTNSLYVQATTTTKNLSVTASTTWGGVQYGPPAAQASAGQVLGNDGAGNLSWKSVGSATFLLSGARPTVTGGTDKILTTGVIPAGTLGLNDEVHIYAQYHNDTGGNTIQPELRIGDGASTSTLFGSVLTNNNGEIYFQWSQQNSLTSEYGQGHQFGDVAGNSSASFGNGASYNAANRIYVAPFCNETSAGDTCRLTTFSITRIVP